MRWLVLVGALVLAMPSQADACDFVLPTYKLAPVDGDTTPPEQPQVVSKVREPASRQTLGCSFPGGCRDIGTILLTVSAKDDRALPTALGYRLKVVGDPGGMNMDLGVDGTLVAAAADGTIALPFRGDDAFAVTIDVAAVDPNGNVGPSVQHTVQVPAAFPWKLVIGIAAPILAVLAIVGFLQRRRRRR